MTCARCDQEMPKKEWLSHKLNQHNNMAWQKDEEPLVNIYSISQIFVPSIKV